ncbi:MAG TPA: hypothetical protein VIN09_13460 [Chloroflexota bacterium]
MTDVELRTQMRDALGCCPAHTWSLVAIAQREVASFLGLALLFQDLVREVRRRLRSDSGIAPSERQCPACASARQAEAATLAARVSAIRRRATDDAPLCLHHLFALAHTARHVPPPAWLAGYRLDRAAAVPLANGPGWLLFGPPVEVEPSFRPTWPCPLCVEEARATAALLSRGRPFEGASPRNDEIVEADAVALEQWPLLCRAHGHRLIQNGGDALVGLLDLQPAALHQWLDRSLAVRRRGLVGRLLAPRSATVFERACPACHETARQVATLARRLSVGDPVAVCLRHLQLVLDAAPPPRRSAWIERADAALDSLERGLGEFIRKHDHRYAHEAWGSEADSWLHAATFFGGCPLRSTADRTERGEGGS